MSIEEGDEVIDPDGSVREVHDVAESGDMALKSEYRLFLTDDEAIDPSEPLRVRVGSEQEARELVDMAAGYDFDAWRGAECRHAKVSETGVIELSTGGTWHIKPLEDDAQVVNYSDRPAQVEAYLKYHSEGETMSDDELTHEVDENHDCKFCGEEKVSPLDPCPEHPDRQREDVSREIAERFMDGASFPEVAQLKKYHDLSWTELVEILRHHCELSEYGVCEWTKDDNGNFETGCDGPTNYALHLEDGNTTQEQMEEDGVSYCPGCGKPIEITTDEGGFEVGDLVLCKEGRCPQSYHYITDISEQDGEAYYSANDGQGLTKSEAEMVEKVGSFAPDDDALERVSPEAKGELVIYRERVLLWPFIGDPVDDPLGVAWNDNGGTCSVNLEDMERTGIVLTFSQIAEVQDESK